MWEIYRADIEAYRHCYSKSERDNHVDASIKFLNDLNARITPGKEGTYDDEGTEAWLELLEQEQSGSFGMSDVKNALAGIEEAASQSCIGPLVNALNILDISGGNELSAEHARENKLVEAMESMDIGSDDFLE